MRTDWKFNSEPIIFGWRKDGRHRWYGDQKQTNVFEFEGIKNSKEDGFGHPSSKPVPLIAYLIKQSTMTNGIVLDGFLGSASTLIACEQIDRMGFTVVPFGQGFKDMSPPTKEFYKLLMEGRIIHGGNPVMAWMAGNVVVDTDPAGNIKPTKAKSPEKIDGIVAAIMALDRCIRNEGQQQGSVYDERDMIVF